MKGHDGLVFGLVQRVRSRCGREGEPSRRGNDFWLARKGNIHRHRLGHASPLVGGTCPKPLPEAVADTTNPVEGLRLEHHCRDGRVA